MFYETMLAVCSEGFGVCVVQTMDTGVQAGIFISPAAEINRNGS